MSISKPIRLILVGLACLELAGCGHKEVSPPSTEVAAESQTNQSQSDEAEATSTAKGDAAIDGALAPLASDWAQNGEGANSADPDSGTEIPASGAPNAHDGAANSALTEGETESDPPSQERFALYASGGPLVVDISIQIDGESLDKGLEQLVERALAAADSDGDGEPTWAEVTEGDAFRYGQFGNLEFNQDEQREMLVRLYDNGNGVVDREELPRFLTRNAGQARSFSLRSSNQYRSGGQSNSALRRLLDTDGSGGLAEAEFDASTAFLLQLDANDDEILSRQEVSQDDDRMPGQLSNMRRRSQPDTAVLINDETKWKSELYALSELYAYEGELQASDWPATPQLFAALDSNTDGTLDSGELSGLAEISPHVVLRLRFNNDPSADSGPSIEITSLHADLESRLLSSHRYPGRCSLSFADAKIEFFVNEDPSLVRSKQFGEQQLNRLDADKNGYLDEDEFPANFPGTQAPFSALDKDGDGMLYVEEVVDFLDLRQAAFRGQVRARTSDQPDTTFTALDTDGDGSLKTREIYEAPQRLRQLDRNGDGRLQGHEIPGTMLVGFVRGNPQADDGLLVVPSTTRSASSDDQTPAWFRGMDANGDGEISSREFLGKVIRFAELDANGDGFLSLDECPK